MYTATIATTHTEAEIIAAAIQPDNTPEMETKVVGSTVETTISRDTSSGLQATVDDYIVNISVADQVIGGVLRATTQTQNRSEQQSHSTETPNTTTHE